MYLPRRTRFLLILLFAYGGLVQAGFAAQQPGQDDAYHLFLRHYGMAGDSSIQEYVNTIADKIIKATGVNSSYKKTLVLNSREVFAFTNDYYIFLSTGLLALLDNESELAAVISHEVVHILHKHSYQSLNKMKSLGELQYAFDNQAYQAMANDLSDTYRKLEMQRTSREFEKAADKEAINYLLAASHDPYAYLSTLAKLQAMTQYYPAHKSDSHIMETLLADHPSFSQRIAYISQLLEQYRTASLHYNNYQKRYQHKLQGMTLLVENNPDAQNKYVLRFTQHLDEQIKHDSEWLVYVLMLNHVASVQELQQLTSIKTIEPNTQPHAK